MNWEQAEQLVERIRKEAPKPIIVVGIEPYGPGPSSTYASDFFVKCRCQVTGLQFVVKSFEHWEDLKEHVLIRICKTVFSFIKRLV